MEANCRKIGDEVRELVLEVLEIRELVCNCFHNQNNGTSLDYVVSQRFWTTCTKICKSSCVLHTLCRELEVVVESILLGVEECKVGQHQCSTR